MTLNELQEMLHPNDRIPLIKLFSRLINREIQQGQIIVRMSDGEDLMKAGCGFPRNTGVNYRLLGLNWI